MTDGIPWDTIDSAMPAEQLLPVLGGGFLVLIGLACFVASIGMTVVSLRDAPDDEKHPTLSRLSTGAVFAALGATMAVGFWVALVFPAGREMVAGVNANMAAAERVDSAHLAAVRTGWGLSRRDAEALIDTASQSEWSPSNRPRKTDVVTLGDGRTINAWLKVDGDRAFLMLSNESSPVPTSEATTVAPTAAPAG